MTGILAWAGALVVSGCTTAEPVPAPVDSGAAQCIPDCSGRECGPDGCGGACGACGPTLSCSAAGVCEDCVASCEGRGQECGEHCGVSCGSCPAGEACSNGTCGCEPTCTAATCGAPDGCGGTCGACVTADETCPDCALSLRVLQRRTVDGVTRSVLLALAYRTPAGSTAERPLLADVRLRIEGPGRLDGVGVSPMVLEAGKELRTDAATGRPYSELDDGTLQVLVWSPSTLRALSDGDWLFFEVALAPGTDVPSAPTQVSLVARAGILAPSSADQTLWGSALAEPLVLWPR